jgi:hypothetical protein
VDRAVQVPAQQSFDLRMAGNHAREFVRAGESDQVFEFSIGNSF